MWWYFILYWEPFSFRNFAIDCASELIGIDVSNSTVGGANFGKRLWRFEGLSSEVRHDNNDRGVLLVVGRGQLDRIPRHITMRCRDMLQNVMRSAMLQRLFGESKSTAFSETGFVPI